MPIPETFKAAVVPGVRAQHVVVDRSLSALGPDEVGIRVTATAINPADWKFRDTNCFIPGYPAVLGSDAAGEIAAVGTKVSGLAVGDRVFFQGISAEGHQSSTFQQYCKMPASLVSRTPGSISDDEAAAVQLATMAVATAFYDSTGFGMTAPWEEGGRTVGKGQALVVIGGSSSVGQYAIQMARLSGFERVVTSASAKHAEHLKALGAHVVLDRNSESSSPEDFCHASLGGGLPLSRVFDAIGIPSTILLGIKTLQLAGASDAVFVRPCGGIVPEDFEGIAAGRGAFTPAEVTKQSQDGPVKVEIKTILGIGSLPGLRHISEPLQTYLGGEEGYIAQGLFRPNQPLVVPGGLEAVETALSKNKEGVSGEKVVIRPFDKV